ncbi:UDP-glycosyltransferase UGT5-like isoform X2 [Malaya genurostris]|uniref:UDP-glycosyltransferase UGT5-like isoform X2 n=1 Tax=Malaya genurostris TaxID=325434 RepID=UPI0026F3B85A|nr:UDP-glycosyltransferase UGT5-like isoform X2 [Malaya genurostris]
MVSRGGLQVALPALLIVALLSLHSTSTEGANILGVLPTWAKSHYVIGVEYLRLLAEIGHNVTVVTPFELADAPENYHEIVMDGILDASQGSNIWTNGLVGTPAPYSHVAHLMLGLTDRMLFWERMYNMLVGVGEQLYYDFRYLPKQKRYYEKAFPQPKLTFEQQMRNVSLILLNQHFSLGSARPYPPNMVEVGGIHIRKVKPLPSDLKRFIEEAHHGVIYFCMGSHIQSKHFPQEKRNAFIEVFAQLKQRVLWKYEDNAILNTPSNVLIQAWMPQNDILAHPNVVIFISHGGLLGTMEALFHGKPIIGIPIFGDQMTNVENAIRSGYGLKLDYDDLNKDRIREAIDIMLNDRTYASKASQHSRWFHDKPMTATENAVFWTEYVIRHRGAPQLRSPAVALNFLQYHSLDILTVVVIFISVILVLTVMLCNVCFRSKKKLKNN